MLIARLLHYIRDAKTLHIFLLEILAVFIGITGSLFVDNWRSEQAEREVLDNLLQETHYNALQDQSTIQRLMSFNNASLQSSMILAYENLDALADDELLLHYTFAVSNNWVLSLQPGYQRLLNTSLSIPFDNTIAELDWHFSNLQMVIADLEGFRRRAELAAVMLAELAGRPPMLTTHYTLNLTDVAAQQMAAFQETVSAVESYQEEIRDAETLRATLGSAEGEAILRELVGQRLNQQVLLINGGQSVRAVVRSIQRYSPNITLPVDSIGLLGGATGIGWNNSIEMQQSPDDHNVWSLEITLADGEVKFRADDDWSSDWGAPNQPQNVANNLLGIYPFTFAGDVAKVFPRGVAEFKGLNIPVEAGHYRVTFNSQTFAYSFERLPDP